MIHYAYILILAFTLSYPLLKSFEDTIRFYTKWKFLFPAIIITAVFFIAWDIWFTNQGVWAFNHEAVVGLFICGLPVEEWLFFFITPFSCVFIHEVLLYFVKKDLPEMYTRFITIAISVICLLLAALNYDRIYTMVVFSLLSVALLIHHFIIRSNYLGRFYITWAVCIIPFLLVDGMITGIPIVTYNSLEITNIRIFTIPAEDLFYGMLQILQVISIYEYLKQKRV